MKRLIRTAVWSLIIILTWFICSCLAPPKETAHAQIRFVSPNARTENQKRVNKLIVEYNDLAAKFNAQIDGQPAWIRKPEDTADVAAQMALKLNDIYSLLIHIDEVDK